MQKYLLLACGLLFTGHGEGGDPEDQEQQEGGSEIVFQIDQSEQSHPGNSNGEEDDDNGESRIAFVIDKDEIDDEDIV